MAANFDPYDKNSWYFGPTNRSEATGLLMSENETGVFLVRNSTSIVGDLVLCVREDNKVSHYIINKIQQSDQTRFRIGDQMFPDVPSLLSFYKLHYLDTTPLIRPAAKKVEKVKARYDFEGSDADDLPFKKSEVLTIVSKDEDQWWTARNSLGQTGSIPVPYVEPIDESLNLNDGQTGNSWHNSQENNSNNTSSHGIPNSRVSVETTKYITPNIQRKLPAMAKVRQQRIPNAYDKTALKLEKGDIIKVTKTNINGQWEGELNGKVGHFPFTHVEFIDNENTEEENH